MRILTTIAGLAAAAAMAAAQNETLACNREAIPATARPRYQELGKRLRGAVREVRELSDGYTLRLEESRMSLAEAAEWMSLERKCCPFLTLRLEASGAQAGSALLTLTGPKGAKEVIGAALK